MNEPTRLEKLRKLAEARPADPFARYGLAMEYLKMGQLDDALAVFEALLSLDPLYVPAYYHAARGLLAAGRRAEAEAIAARGFHACDAKGDAHAKEELLALISTT
jgi:tetratricopeptide (TPR) repeat protein